MPDESVTDVDSVMWFALVRQVLGEQAPVRAVAEVRPDVRVVVGAPGLLAGAARERGVDRPAGRREAPARAADEAALLVGLVELERLDEVAELALPAHQRLLEQAGDVGERMHHQPLADEPGRVRQAVRMRRARPTAAAAAACRSRSPPATTTLAGSKCSAPSRVDPGRAGREARGVGLDPADAGAGHEPGAQRRSPSASGSGRSRPWRPRCSPTGRCSRWTHGRRPSYGDRVDRVELRPPVPAELRVGPGDLQPGRADRQRRHRRVLGVGRIGRVARQPRHAELRGRSGRSTAAARSSRSASRRRRRRASGPGSRTAAARGQAPAKMIVEPPTALYMSGETGGVVLDDRVVLRETADVRAGRPVLAGLELPVELVAAGSRPGRATRPARGRRP